MGRQAPKTKRPARPTAPPRRRLTGPARAEAILQAAAELFAERGLGGTTRQIAGRLGVTQALLYKFFPSKDALIDAVYAGRFRDRWDPAWDRLLADEGLSLETRLCRFYGEYAARSDATTLRLFVLAGLAGRPLPGIRGARLTGRIFAPVLAGLREAAGLPSLAARPMMRGERELCMQLHGSIVFLGIRRHVYGVPLPDDRDDVIALYVRSFVAGAPAALRALHAGDEGWRGLRVRQLRPPRR
jgi:AcrR family transcriptional regulator